MDREGEEPIGDDELIYRRIPVNTGFYNVEAREVSRNAFSPSPRDTTGVSVSRSKYSTAEEAAQEGSAGKQYYVAVLNAKEMKDAGIELTPKPDLGDGKFSAAHAELPQLNISRKKDSETQERMEKLRSLVIRVEGPFEAPAEPSA